jgi:hypothetical protein
MATQTFELVSPFLTIYAPSKKWAGDSSLLLGQTVNRLVTGELLSYTGANGVIRTSDHGIGANDIAGQTKWCAPYFSETGRGDIVTGGSVPVLQFGPFEADTMLFMRAGDDAVVNGEGQGSLAAGAHAGFDIGVKVYAAAVRNPINGSSFNSSNFVIGIAPEGGISNASDAICVGRVSRVIGSGASAKIRVMFGVN